MPVTATARTMAQRRNMTAHGQPAKPTLSPLDTITAAVRQLEQAPEKTPQTLDAIEILDTLRRSIKSGNATPADFKMAHRALYAAGLETGGLHVALDKAEDTLRNGRRLMPAAR